MKALRIVAIALAVYALIVVAFESTIGYMQPTPGGTMLITTFDADGTAHDRVVSRLESNGQLYAAANHWPRAWYKRALANPNVQATVDGQRGDYHVVPVSGEEKERVNTEHSLPLFFRFLTGFPPRLIVRLDPRTAAGNTPS